MPVDPAQRGGRCVRPFRLGDRSASLPHSARDHRAQQNGGRMNGFVKSQVDLGVPDPRSPMGFYDGRDLPFYWNLADQYVLFDRFFAASPGGSVSNHLHWLTATSGDPRYPDLIPPGGFRRHPDDLRPAAGPRGSPGRSTSRTTTRRSPSARAAATARRRRRPGCRCCRSRATSTTRTAPAHRRPLASSSPTPTAARCRPCLRRPGVLERAPARAPAGRPAARPADRRFDAAQPAVALLGVPVDLRHLGRLVRPRATAEGPSASASPRCSSAPGRAPPRRPHAAGHHVGAAVHRGQLAPARAAPDDRRARTFIDAFDFSAGPRPAVIPALARAHRPPERVRRSVIYAGYGGAALLAAVLIAGGALIAPGRRARRGRRDRLRGTWR